MSTEAQLLAARLAAASEVFPISKPDEWDSSVRVTAQGNVITAVVTEHMGRAQRTYRAVLQPVDFDLLAPVALPPGVASAGPWRIDDRRHLVRDLSDGRTQLGNGTVEPIDMRTAPGNPGGCTPGEGRSATTHEGSELQQW